MDGTWGWKRRGCLGGDLKTYPVEQREEGWYLGLEKRGDLGVDF